MPPKTAGSSPSSSKRWVSRMTGRLWTSKSNRRASASSRSIRMVGFQRSSTAPGRDGGGVGSHLGVHRDPLRQPSASVRRRGAAAPPPGEAVALLAGQRPRSFDGSSDVLPADREGPRSRRSVRYWALHRGGGSVVLHVLDDQLAASGGPFVLGQRTGSRGRCLFPLLRQRVLGKRGHLGDDTCAWIEMLHRPSFATGLAVPFARPPSSGPPHATRERIQARSRATPGSSL